MWKNYLTIALLVILAFFSWSYFFAEEEVNPEEKLTKPLENPLQADSFRGNINTSFDYKGDFSVDGVFSGIMDVNIKKGDIRGSYETKYYSKGASFDFQAETIMSEEDLYLNVSSVPFWGVVREDAERIKGDWVKIEKREELNEIFKEEIELPQILSRKEEEIRKIIPNLSDLELKNYRGREMVRGMELYAYTVLLEEEKLDIWVDRNYFIRKISWNRDIDLSEITAQGGVLGQDTLVILSHFNQDFSIAPPEEFLTMEDARIKMLSDLQREEMDGEIKEHFHKIKENIEYYRYLYGSYKDHEVSDDWTWMKGRVPECGFHDEYQIRVSSGGDSYVVWVAFCSRDRDYYCMDSEGFKGDVEKEPQDHYCKTEEN